jgi:hypothetical protein
LKNIDHNGLLAKNSYRQRHEINKYDIGIENETHQEKFLRHEVPTGTAGDSAAKNRRWLPERYKTQASQTALFPLPG